MRDEHNYFTDEELEIDLVDLCKRLLKRWKLGVLFALIGAVLGGGFALGKYYWKESHKPAYSEEKLQAAESKLSEGEKMDANRVYGLYQTYFRLEDVQRDHIRHSVLMTLDPETAVTKNRQYLLTTTQAGAGSMLRQKVLDRELYEDLAAYAGDPEYADYIQELVSMGVATWQAAQGISLRGEELAGKGSAASDAGIGNASNPAMAGLSRWQFLVTLTATGGDEAYVNGILDILDSHFQDALATIETADPALAMEALGDTLIADGGESIVESQKQLMQSVTDVVTERKKFVTDTINKLNDRQKEYLEQLGLRDDMREPETKEGRGLVKMSAVGFISGCFVFCVVLFLPYLFGGVVRTEREVESQYGIRLLRSVHDVSDPAAVETAAQMVVKELAGWKKSGDEVLGDTSAAGTGAGKRAAYFLTCETPSAENGFIPALLREAEAKGVTLTVGDPAADPAALEQMLGGDGVIFDVKVDQTKREALKDFGRLAAGHGLPILGYVVE